MGDASRLRTHPKEWGGRIPGRKTNSPENIADVEYLECLKSLRTRGESGIL